MIVPETYGNNMVMPVSPMGGYGNGGFDGGWGSWIILFLIFGMFGNGGFGGFNGGMNFDFPWLMSNTNNGFNQQAIQTGLSDVRLGIADVSQQICNSGNNIVQQMYANQIAELERSFAAQTANTQGLNALQAQFAQCCCDNRLATVQTQNVVQNEAAATRQTMQQGIQTISDKLCQLELDQYKRENDDLRTQLNTATQTAQIENYIRPQINPAYVVPNPYASCPNASTGFQY